MGETEQTAKQRGRKQHGRKKWRGKALVWAVAGMAGYFAIVDFCWLLLSSGSFTLAAESGLVAILLVLLVGWPAWLIVWAVALLCGGSALALVPKEKRRLRLTCFMLAIASGCGAVAYGPLALIYGTEISWSPFSPLFLALVTFFVGLFAAWSYYPGRRPGSEQEPSAL
ncbi:hypothetical protein [Segniliparus rugosus]|uniref:Transmembrane protein n=1 Tax=Segniliparus rugosus (strain ATCC BAA-974 / DSM 45345 / CCUG 50838 / CIP 108380 / JCM 13579 / CDC 945) TaxID=679197 RepID=E5XPR6_SEGRC|nr:hypothetical protein [Segniliparus rugosus]EFV13664.1 hypothetical protein HMPREF9336_01488 [Segniliparus rugosus ATCC BAA-974]